MEESRLKPREDEGRRTDRAGQIWEEVHLNEPYRMSSLFVVLGRSVGPFLADCYKVLDLQDGHVIHVATLALDSPAPRSPWQRLC